MRKAKAIVQSIFNPDKPKGREYTSDCAFCWCDTCVHLETCQMRRASAHNVTRNTHPLPCVGCREGRPFMPVDMRQCRNYQAREAQPGAQSKE